MDVAELYDRVAARLPGGAETTTEGPEALVHAVLMSLAERLSPDEAAELGAELPVELGDLLAGATGDGVLEREEFIEDLAARLDLDDDDAEVGATAVLVSLREFLEPVVAIEQVLETLPPDLAQLMHG
ncbi:MAG TPA: DUF2267 domain-containing protein [Polyangia bacterium]|jgi:uncharacterized protein (DUF2267 family)